MNVIARLRADRLGSIAFLVIAVYAAIAVAAAFGWSGDWELRVTHPSTGTFTVRRRVEGAATTILATPGR